MKSTLLCICFAIAASGAALAEGDMHEYAGKAYTSQVLAKSSQSWDGTPLPEYPRGTPEVVVVKITIAPGAELPMHKHPSINAGMLLSGELTVITEGDKVKHLKAGEGLIELVNQWHYGKNEGTVPAEILVVYASTKDAPLAVSKE